MIILSPKQWEAGMYRLGGGEGGPFMGREHMLHMRADSAHNRDSIIMNITDGRDAGRIGGEDGATCLPSIIRSVSFTRTNEATETSGRCGSIQFTYKISLE
ncbi:hypothetical protein EVAR_12500_1 [Eumeta japonica]|uniref:Uncharacterized protein n=1 Tax=Eumeta variegata TaxID=151549 RepID=A0A4C1TPK3_EUMVA|nr:hypothetical protein EVAR_12500_1 [Eumeta japonica]